MEITRIKNTDQHTFINEFLLPGKPVIITDAMEKWKLEQFTPEALSRQFGHYEVQIYNELFDLQTIDTLKAYLDNNFNKQEQEAASKEYIRWYTQLKDVDFFWSDEVFTALQQSWQNPYFFSGDSLAIPFTTPSAIADINTTRFPYKGLFISGQGARTRLHRDPFNSDAILCQFHGQKKIHLYSPEQAQYVMNGSEFVDIMNPDHARFPEFASASCTYEDTLSPGEIVLFPSGWFHDVSCLSDSISITWNFVHASKLPGFYKYIATYPDDDQLEIVRFFLGEWLSENADIHEITDFLKSRFA